MDVNRHRRVLKIKSYFGSLIASFLTVIFSVILFPFRMCNLQPHVKGAFLSKVRCVLDIGSFRVYGVNAEVVVRSKLTFIKEADTVRWIKSLPKEAILWDVGANIGMFTLLASSRGVRVLAFEPQAENYALLIRNIDLNKFEQRPIAFSVPLFDTEAIGDLHVSSIEPGSAMNTIKPTAPGASQSSQNIVSMTGHRLVEMGAQAPTHIKLDVDGNELQVLSGLGSVLDTVEQVWLEMPLTDPCEFDQLKSYLELRGFASSTTLAEGKFQNFLFSKTAG